MHHVLNPSDIADWIANYGYWGIFACVFVGNLGVPMPEETVLLAAGFLAGEQFLEVKTVFAVAVISAVVGDNFGYYIGRTGGRRLLERLSRTFRFASRRYQRFKEFFSAHGNKTVFFARFIAGLRFMAGPMAGACGMPFWSFFGWNVLGAIVWCATMVTIGYLLGDNWEAFAGAVHRGGPWIVLGIVLIGLAAYLLFWRGTQPAARPEP